MGENSGSFDDEQPHSSLEFETSQYERLGGGAVWQHPQSLEVSHTVREANIAYDLVLDSLDASIRESHGAVAWCGLPHQRAGAGPHEVAFPCAAVHQQPIGDLLGPLLKHNWN
jgi:hypothetical protein